LIVTLAAAVLAGAPLPDAEPEPVDEPVPDDDPVPAGAPLLAVVL
jgi:hypothetical protein